MHTKIMQTPQTIIDNTKLMRAVQLPGECSDNLMWHGH